MLPPLKTDDEPPVVLLSKKRLLSKRNSVYRNSSIAVPRKTRPILEKINSVQYPEFNEHPNFKNFMREERERKEWRIEKVKSACKSIFG